MTLLNFKRTLRLPRTVCKPLHAWMLQVGNLLAHKAFHSVLDHWPVNFPKCRVILLWPLLLALSLLSETTLKKLSFSWEFSSNIWRAIRFASSVLFPMLNNPSTRLIFLPFYNQPSKGPWSQLKTSAKSGNGILAPPVFKLLNFSYGKVQEALESEECLH